MTFNPDIYVNSVLDDMDTITPVPATLTIYWDYDDLYSFDEISESSAVIWADLIMDTFCEDFPGVEWEVDSHPGWLYDQDQADLHQGAAQSPYDLEQLQITADKTLDRYRQVFDRLISLGVTVVPD